MSALIPVGEIRKAARELRISPDELCTTCGRVAFISEHFGHRVTRIWETEMPLTPASGPPDVEFLNVRQVAAELAVSKMTVYRLIDGGELRAHQFGRSRRVSRVDLARYVRGSVLIRLDEDDDDGAPLEATA